MVEQGQSLMAPQLHHCLELSSAQVLVFRGNVPASRAFEVWDHVSDVKAEI